MKMKNKQAWYVMVELLSVNGSTYFHPAFECFSKEEAEEIMLVLDKYPYEVSRKIVSGLASNDCRELRPC